MARRWIVLIIVFVIVIAGALTAYIIYPRALERPATTLPAYNNPYTPTTKHDKDPILIFLESPRKWRIKRKREAIQMHVVEQGIHANLTVAYRLNNAEIILDNASNPEPRKGVGVMAGDPAKG